MSTIQVIIAIGLIVYYIVRAVSKNDDKSTAPRPRRQQRPAQNKPTSSPGEPSLEDIFREFLEQEDEKPQPRSILEEHPLETIQPEDTTRHDPKEKIESTLKHHEASVEKHSSSFSDTSSPSFDYEAKRRETQRKLKEARERKMQIEAKYGKKVSDENSPIYQGKSDSKFSLKQAIIGQIILERKHS